MARRVNKPADFRWYLPDLTEKERAASINAMATSLREEQRGRIEQDILHMCLYGGRQIAGYGLASYWQTLGGGDTTLMSRLGVNLTRNATNAVVSRIGKGRPRPTVVTDDGDWELQDKAESLQRFIDGAFYEAKVYELDLRWLLLTCVLGTGLMKVYRADDPHDPDDPGRIACDVCLPGQVVVDEIEAIDGRPRQMLQRYYVDKAVLQELYPDKADELEKVRLPDEEDVGLNRQTNQVLVIEIWHLRSGAKAKDGRHTILCGDVVLKDEEYKRDSFPFVKMKYDEELLGFWGCGLAEQACGYQAEINELLLKGARILDLAAIPKVFVEAGSNVNQDAWTNEAMTFIPYTGAMPQVVTPQGLIDQLMKQASLLRDWFYQEIGVSEMMARGEKPAGIDAAVALETLAEQDTERLTKLARRWDQGHLDLAELFVDIAKEINEGDEEAGIPPKEYCVVWRGAESMGRMNWSEVDMPRDKFIMQMTPTSMLAMTVGGKLQRATELLKLGALDIDQFVDVLDLPDLKRATSAKTAPLRYLKKVATSLKKGKYISPEPDDNLELAFQFMLAELQSAKVAGRPESVLSLFRQYLVALASEKQRRDGAGAPAGPGTPQLASGVAPGMSPEVPQGAAPPQPGGPPPGVPLQ